MVQVSFALMGCGPEGRHVAQMAERLQVFRSVAVQDENPLRAEACATELGVEAMSSLEQLLAREEVDAVLVATPNDTHREVVGAALAAGKAVYVIPPLALTTADCEALLTAATEHKGKLLVGHTRRFHPLLAQLQRTVSLGSLGQPVAASMVRREMVPLEEDRWERSGARTGGALRHWGIEEIDFLRAAFGPVTTVYALAGPGPLREGLDFPDTVSLQLGFESGLAGQLQLCLTDYLPSAYGAVMGPQGSLSFDLTRGLLHYRRGDGIEVKFEPNEVERAAFVREAAEKVLKSFAAWVTEEKEPVVKAVDACAAVAIAEAGMVSLETGAVARVGETGVIREG